MWYYRITEIFEEDLIELDNKFIKKYSSFLVFKNSYLTYTPFQVSKKKGFRLDRHIIAEILPIHRNKSVTLEFTYNSFEKKPT